MGHRPPQFRSGQSVELGRHTGYRKKPPLAILWQVYRNLEVSSRPLHRFPVIRPVRRAADAPGAQRINVYMGGIGGSLSRSLGISSGASSPPWPRRCSAISQVAIITWREDFLSRTDMPKPNDGGTQGPPLLYALVPIG